MKSFPLLRLVPNPLKRRPLAGHAVAPPLPLADDQPTVRYIPVWLGTQVMPFPVVMPPHRRKRPGSDYAD
jgi:hypothetical protein